jgi:hypothetical protein
MKITLLQIHFHSLVHKDHITINLVQIWQFITIALKEVFPPKFKIQMAEEYKSKRFLTVSRYGYQQLSNNVETKSSRRRLLRYFHFSINVRNLGSFREFIFKKKNTLPKTNIHPHTNTHTHKKQHNDTLFNTSCKLSIDVWTQFINHFLVLINHYQHLLWELYTKTILKRNGESNSISHISTINVGHVLCAICENTHFKTVL